MQTLCVQLLSEVKNWLAANEQRSPRLYRLVASNIWIFSGGAGAVVMVPRCTPAPARPVAVPDNRSGDDSSCTNNSSNRNDRYQPDDRDTDSIHSVGSTQERLRRFLISPGDRSRISTILFREAAPATSEILLLDSPSCFDRS